MEVFRKIINRFIDVVMAILGFFLGSAAVLYAANSILRYGFKTSFNCVSADLN
jgi:TRAP-type C4-dicarboxylate transport system permease small subunit